MLSQVIAALAKLSDMVTIRERAGPVQRTGQQALPSGPKLRAMAISALWELDP
jgi:hypothetical protein